MTSHTLEEIEEIQRRYFFSGCAATVAREMEIPERTVRHYTTDIDGERLEFWDRLARLNGFDSYQDYLDKLHNNNS